MSKELEKLEKLLELYKELNNIHITSELLKHVTGDTNNGN